MVLTKQAPLGPMGRVKGVKGVKGCKGWMEVGVYQLFGMGRW